MAVLKQNLRERPSIGFALGSGAIRGLAHIGVFNALDRAGISPDIVVGASVGALIGAFHAIGQDLKMIEAFAGAMDWKYLADFSIKGKGLIRGDKVSSLLRLLLKDLTFADCRYKFVAVATDLCTGEKVLLEDGPLAEAVRASISIPGVFAPVNRSGRILVDGGLVGRVPATTARELGADIIIGVDVSGDLKDYPGPGSTIEVIMQAIDIMENEISRRTLQAADIVVSPKIRAIGPLDLSKAAEIVRSGENAVNSVISEITSLLGGMPLETEAG